MSSSEENLANTSLPKRSHSRTELDSVGYIEPKTGDSFNEMDHTFTVVKGTRGMIFFSTQEVLEHALRLKNYYPKLPLVDPRHRTTIRVRRGSVPMVFVTQTGLQTLLDTVRFGKLKQELVKYLNINYDAFFRSRPLRRNEPQCDACIYYKHQLERMTAERNDNKEVILYLKRSLYNVYMELNEYKEICSVLGNRAPNPLLEEEDDDDVSKQLD